jgi:hypothetical protein
MPCGLAHVPAGKPSSLLHGSGTSPGLVVSVEPARPAGVSDATTSPLSRSGLKVTTSPGEPP